MKHLSFSCNYFGFQGTDLGLRQAEEKGTAADTHTTHTKVNGKISKCLFMPLTQR